MAKFEVQINGFGKLQQVFKELPDKARTEISAEITAICEEWAGMARADAPADTGLLRMGVVEITNGALFFEVKASTNYAAYQEFGTKGNARIPAALSEYASEFTGPGENNGVNVIQALTMWVDRKGIGDGKNSKSIAFLIWRKIKTTGLKPQSFLFSSKGAEGSGDRLALYVDKIKRNVALVLKRLL